MSTDKVALMNRIRFMSTDKVALLDRIRFMSTDETSPGPGAGNGSLSSPDVER